MNKTLLGLILSVFCMGASCADVFENQASVKQNMQTVISDKSVEIQKDQKSVDHKKLKAVASALCDTSIFSAMYYTLPKIMFFDPSFCNGLFLKRNLRMCLGLFCGGLSLFTLADGVPFLKLFKDRASTKNGVHTQVDESVDVKKGRVLVVSNKIGNIMKRLGKLFVFSAAVKVVEMLIDGPFVRLTYPFSSNVTIDPNPFICRVDDPEAVKIAVSLIDRHRRGLSLEK